MRKPLSTMTAQQFVEYTGALDLTYTKLAVELRKSQPTISQYANGRQPIPLEVAQQLKAMIDTRVQRLTELGAKLNADDVIGSLIVHANEQKMRGNREPHKTTGRFMRKTLKPDTRVYPAYRMSVERYQLYVSALASWGARVRELAIEHTDAARQRDYQLELADLRSMAGSMPRHAPYDLLIQRNEWDVVSRALRHHGTKSPELYRATAALRMHWSKHRGSGYPHHTGVASA